MVVAGCKAGYAQYPQRILYKMWRHVPQDFGIEVGSTPVRVNNNAGLIHRHGVNSEIAPFKILFQGDRRVGMDDKTVIAGS